MSDDRPLNAHAIALLDRYDPEDGSEEQRRLAGHIGRLLTTDADRLDDEVLITLLDYPPGADTDPIVAAATAELSRRGPGVVEALLTTALDGGETAEPRALEILDGMDEREAVQGLIEVLGSDAQEFVKRAAVDALVAIGEGAVEALQDAAESPRSQHLALAALDRLDVRYGPATLYDPGEDWTRGERDEECAAAQTDESFDESPDEAVDEVPGQGVDETPDRAVDGAPDEMTGDEDAEEEPEVPPAPDEDAMNESYKEFLRDWQRRERP